MLFNSGQFLIFFPIVVCLYFLLPKKLKNGWLLVSSWYFYACWNAKYLLLLLASTVVTWLSGLLIGREDASGAAADIRARRRKLIVAACLVVNLGILVLFKYANFLISLINGAAARLGFVLNAPGFDVLLPVGISFYTFQALGYTIDVYRGDIAPERNFFRYALFVSFFPQLVAGPIERSGSLLGQLSVTHDFNWDSFREGLLLMLWGFFLKLVIADRLALFVDAVYGAPQYYGGCYLLLATMLFGVQIYCDFYGYSVIAMGCGRVLGIELMDNFKAPYLAGSVAEFWRSWHISLTSWFRDYLYFPLGGSRRGRGRKLLNIMIVFLTSGLWHGANLTYILWGGLIGAYQVVGEWLKPLRDGFVKLFHINRDSFGHRLYKTLATDLLILPTWVLFRSGSLGQIRTVFSSIVHVRNPWIFFDGSLFLSPTDRQLMLPMTFCLLALYLADILKKRGIVVHKLILRQDFWFRALAFALSVVLILTLGVWGPGFSEANFIYFQF